MGRPPTLPAQLKDGFYIEVRNKGASSGVKIRSDKSEAMLAAAEEYRKNKEVILLGEHKGGKWVNADSSEKAKKSKRK